MPLFKRANEQSEQLWLPVPEGLWRWIIGAPELRMNERFGKYEVKFPLELTEEERARLMLETDDVYVPEGTQQSWRTQYTPGFSLGFMAADGQYRSTNLIDFMAAAVGHANGKRFREWIAAGGGYARPADKDDDKAELESIAHWLAWFENLELYGSIRHAPDKQNPQKMWARFGGPMAVGSLPNQKDDAYQAIGRGKLRAMIAEWQASGGGTTAPDAKKELVTAIQQETARARTAVAAPPEDDDIPF